MFLSIFISLTILVTALYDPSKYQLGGNLVSNYQFDNPFLGTQESVYYSLGMPGWNCTVDCQHVNIQKRCANAPMGAVNCVTSF